jgi:hypothetical protein
MLIEVIDDLEQQVAQLDLGPRRTSCKARVAGLRREAEALRDLVEGR